MGGEPGETVALTVTVSPLPAVIVSPVGIAPDGSCGAQTPFGIGAVTSATEMPAPGGSVNTGCGIALPSAETMETPSQESTPPTCIGAMASVPLTANALVTQPVPFRGTGLLTPMVAAAPLAAAALATETENSGTSSHGLAAEPSGAGVPPAGVMAPSRTAADSTGFPPPPVRYFCANVFQPSGGVLASVDPPKEIVAEVTSRSMVALPWKSGPSTVTWAPRWNDSVTVMCPKNRSMSIVMPAAIDA